MPKEMRGTVIEVPINGCLYQARQRTARSETDELKRRG
jgi:hypothetical protein